MVAEVFGVSSRSSDVALLLSQVEEVFEVPSLDHNVCLPSLETLELYSYASGEGGGSPFELGSPLADQQGARGLCNCIGALVAKGTFPSLKQVKRSL